MKNIISDLLFQTHILFAKGTVTTRLLDFSGEAKWEKVKSFVFENEEADRRRKLVSACVQTEHPLPATPALTSLLSQLINCRRTFGLKCILYKKICFLLFSFLQFTLGQTSD